MPTEHAPAAPRRHVSPYLLLTLTALFWAGNFIVGRALREQIEPIPLNFWRWTVALAVLLPFAWGELRRSWRAVLRHRTYVGALGVLGVVCYQTFVYLALQTTPALNALLFMATVPVAIIVASWIAYRERLTGRQAVGVAVSLVGALAVIARGDLEILLALRLASGDLWLLGAVLVWAVYSILLKRRPPDLPPLALLIGTILAGLMILIPLYLWRVWAGDTIIPTAGSALGILYVGVFASALAFLFWNRGVAEVGANRAGAFIHLMPVFGAVLSVLLLGERIAAYHLIGAALVFGGIVVASRKGPAPS